MQRAVQTHLSAALLPLAVAGLTFATPAAALDIVACLAGTTAQQLNDDPRTCPPDRRIDAVSIGLNVKQLASGATGGGAGASKPQVSDVKLAKRLDGSSPTLFRLSLTGRHTPSVLVVGFEGDPRGRTTRSFTLLLQDVLVTQYDFSAEDTRREGGTSEIVNFSYGQITIRDDATGQSVNFDVRQFRVN
jgi:type VI protein secretion system component Hcp